MQPCKMGDLWSSLGSVGDACAGQEGGKAAAPGMLELRCEWDSWSLSLPVLGAWRAQEQKRLI